MSRYIDADALEPDADYYEGDYWAVSIVQIHNAPTIEPRKKGKWLASDDMYETGICSCCRLDSREPFDYAIANFHFCPNCGAEMSTEDKG